VGVGKGFVAAFCGAKRVRTVVARVAGCGSALRLREMAVKLISQKTQDAASDGSNTDDRTRG
jgi:hypothetical protein